MKQITVIFVEGESSTLRHSHFPNTYHLYENISKRLHHILFKDKKYLIIWSSTQNTSLLFASLCFPEPGPGPGPRPRPLALAPNLYLPILVPNLFLLALAPTPDLYLPVQVKILLLPQLLLILFTTSTINITATSTTTTTATTTNCNTNDKCICGSKMLIKWPLKDIWWKSQVLFQ